MKKWARMAAVAATVGGTMAGGLLGLAGAASAAQSTQPIDCSGLGTITISTNNNHSSDNGGWSAAQIVDGSGHLMPTSFAFGANDDTLGTPLFGPFIQLKGGGNANKNQPTVTCTQTQTATLGDLIAENGPVPGPLPAGASDTDQVTVTFTVTAIPKI